MLKFAVFTFLVLLVINSSTSCPNQHFRNKHVSDNGFYPATKEGAREFVRGIQHVRRHYPNSFTNIHSIFISPTTIPYKRIEGRDGKDYCEFEREVTKYECDTSVDPAKCEYKGQIVAKHTLGGHYDPKEDDVVVYFNRYQQQITLYLIQKIGFTFMDSKTTSMLPNQQ